MKIAIDISQKVHPGTGVDTYTRNLVREVLRLNSAGKHEYILFGTSLRRKHIFDFFSAQLRMEGLRFKSSFWLLPPTFTTQLWNQIHHFKIERLIGKIDLFHSSDWTQPPTGAKKVTTIHDLVVYKHPESSHPQIISVQKKKLDWSKKECDAIIVDSLATKKDCHKLLMIPNEKMHVIPLAAGNNVNEFASKNDSEKEIEIHRVRDKYQLTKPYILAVGTREPRKNLERLVEAVKKISGVDLVIVGKFGWGNSIRTKQLKIENNSKILGFVSEQDVQPIYAGAIAYVHPSLYEGFGITIVEAMTLGVPVITSNVSCLPEAGGDAALYINPHNVDDIRKKIIEVIQLSPEKRKILIQKSLNQAKKFSWEKTARETLKVYEEVYGKK